MSEVTTVTIRCVGCGTQSLMRIAGALAFTCWCGSRIFMCNGQIQYPASLVLYLLSQEHGIAMGEFYRKEVAHIEYYLGYSDYMDDVKKRVLDSLKLAGAISMLECDNAGCSKFVENAKSQLKQYVERNVKWSDLQLALMLHLPVSVVKDARKAKKQQSF